MRNNKPAGFDGADINRETRRMVTLHGILLLFLLAYLIYGLPYLERALGMLDF